MNKVIKTSLAMVLASGLSVVAAQSLSTVGGWTLAGTSVNIADVETTLSDADMLWAWEAQSNAGRWMFKAPNNSVMNEQAKDIGLGDLVGLKAGQGFWINDNGEAYDLGTSVTGNLNVELKAGWNLISYVGSGNILSKLNNIAGLTIAWTMGADNTWKGYSPSLSMNTLIANEYSIIESVSEGQGVWVYVQLATIANVNLDSSSEPVVPYQVIVMETTGNMNQVPVPDATIFNASTGAEVGKTDRTGNLLSSEDLSGVNLTVYKSGYSMSTIGFSSTRKTAVAMLSKIDVTQATSTAARTLGATKPDPAPILPQPDNTAITIQGTPSGGSVTVVTSSFVNENEIPKFTKDIIVGGIPTEPKELSIIGGAYIHLENALGQPILDDSYKNIDFKFGIYQDKLIGGFEAILNGLTGSTVATNQTLKDKAKDELDDALEKGLISIHTLQIDANGDWKEIDTDTKFVKNANTGKYQVLMDNGSKYLNDFSTIAFVIKTNAVEGTTNVCFKESGERMLDGSFVTENQSDQSTFDYIGEGVEGMVAIADQNVLNAPLKTGPDGCINIEYKVPFLHPEYKVTMKKDGHFDIPLIVDVRMGNLDRSLGDINADRKPTAASIEGYVLDKANSQGIDNAVVTIQDPQLLREDLIEIVNDDANKSISVPFAPNVTYTWTLSKEINATDTWTHIMKNGMGQDNTYLTSDELQSYLLDTFDDANTSNDPFSLDVMAPTGQYRLHISALHDYNDGKTFTEEIAGVFNISVDRAELMSRLTYSTNQGTAPIYKNEQIVDSENPLTQKEGLYTSTWSVYGGKAWGDLYALSDGQSIATPNPYWDARVYTYLGVKGASDGPVDETICMDLNTVDNLILKSKINVPGEETKCYTNLIEPYNVEQTIYKFGDVVSMISDNLATFLKPAQYIGSSDNALQDGFTIMNTYVAKYPTIDDVNITSYVPSYTNLDNHAINSVREITNVSSFNISGNEPIGFTTRHVATDSDGYYRFNYINPTFSNSVELVARAEEYKFDSADNFHLVGDLAIGEVYRADFYLTKIAPDPIVYNFDTDLSGWDDVNLTLAGNWNTAKEKIQSVKWQVIEGGNVVGSTWYKDNVFAGAADQAKLLAPAAGTGYAWFGDVSTGTYSDNTDSQDSGTSFHSDLQVGKAMSTTDYIDFSNYSLANLNMKTWFEVGMVDASEDVAFVGFEVQGEPGEYLPITWTKGQTFYVLTNTAYIFKVTPSVNVPGVDVSGLSEQQVYDKYATQTYSNMGSNADIAWSDYNIPLDFLAGKRAKIMFGFITANNGFNSYRGWGVDEVTISDSLQQTLLLAPQTPTNIANAITTNGSITPAQ